MYVCKKRNRSGTFSVVFTSKSFGKYKEIECLGTVDSEEDAENLCDAVQRWIRVYAGQEEFDFDDNPS